MMMEGEEHLVYSTALSDNVASALAHHRSSLDPLVLQSSPLGLQESTAYFHPGYVPAAQVHQQGFQAEQTGWQPQQQASQQEQPQPQAQEWDGPRLCLVIDTNVFLTGLSYLETFLTASNDLPFLVVLALPLTVVEELDSLKDAHRMCQDETGREVPISQLARRAIRWIQNMFQRHPHHIIGQRMADVHIRSPVLPVVKQNDDRILHFALALQYMLLARLRQYKMKILLLSHDRALCVKATMNGLASCSHHELPADPHTIGTAFTELSWTVDGSELAATQLDDTESEEFVPRAVEVIAPTPNHDDDVDDDYSPDPRSHIELTLHGNDNDDDDDGGGGDGYVDASSTAAVGVGAGTGMATRSAIRRTAGNRYKNEAPLLLPPPSSSLSSSSAPSSSVSWGDGGVGVGMSMEVDRPDICICSAYPTAHLKHAPGEPIQPL
ncbi:hypothetical protein PTSG_09022 [Salpingoeca rosetta]|uniref:PIN domain-containing protein n=1 Tax=Salpingoeca rosetta (strain ATCC 50818 / BSB-021) TaxID=946362 RepID=F2ULZ7_SALR5|nr:uncharacterized protein PTSG_09022 [Salpingoeca rosetta]EGD78146.1 hypothetical protein PTSG_09022 [Salpingoeca rosetta]|eukprot:XP_004989822.1 hypothetical protein PTSG_09022 [Salpingoeca rosetta]